MHSRSNRSSSSDTSNSRRRRGFSRLLQNLLTGGAGAGEVPKRSRLLLETLEKRQLLAGDMELLFTDGSEGETEAEVVQTSGLQVEGQAEGEPAPDLVQFAKDLGDAGVIFYGAEWCPACTLQKEAFEDGGNDLPFIEVTDYDRRVTNPDDILNAVGRAEGISVFPTWEFPDGTRLEGVQTLQTLSERSNVPIPQSEQPIFETIGNLTVRDGSPLHVPVDAYDPDGGPLTVTVEVDDPSLLTATVLTGNRSIRIDMETYGDIVIETFEQRAPNATGRIITLAEQGFYDGIIFHRLADDFVIQGGDPNGIGTGGSNLGNFDDDFHPDLQHNREGVASYAKSSDDTNNSQFFLTEIATRFLDFNHSVWGQIVEGSSVREAISEQSTPQSRTGDPFASQKPEIDIPIETIEVFNDIENSVVMLKATGAGTGTTGVTFTVTDQDGNTHSETITVAVAPDNANSQPFLGDIAPPAPTPMNTTAQLQLTSTDIEDDAVTYTATSLSSVSSGSVAVNPTTGLVSVTPAFGFEGTINVRVGVEPGPGVIGNGDDDSDTQLVSFVFEGESILPPSSVDLLASSDTGIIDSDNVTNAGSLSFQISGVTDGAIVELFDTSTGTQIGTATATGSTVVITTDNIAALGDGTYEIAARTRIGNDTSAPSQSLTVVYDSTAPDSVIGTVLTQGNVNRQYVTDLMSSEEGSGLMYALTSAPAGAVIDSATGVINWTPQSIQTGANEFTLELTDPAGNVRSEMFTVDVAGEPLAEVRLEITDLAGNPLTSVSVGQSFLLNLVAVDARPFIKPGVFAAYADVLFDQSLVRPIPSIALDFTDEFTLVQKGTFLDGLIDELGAVNNSLVATDIAESLVVSVTMEAVAAGTAIIRSDPAEESDSEYLLYGIDDPIDADSVFYGSVSLNIGQDFTLNDDDFTLPEDSGATTLDVLANDEVTAGGGSLSVVAVTQPASGGTVSLSGGTVSFTPDANVNGEVIFTYRAADTSGVQDTATVTLTLTPENDPPTGQSDSFNVDAGSTANVLDVLANDSDDPDDGETLTVSDVDGTTAEGGTVEISGGGANVSYTPPAGFTGTDTFSYTVSDGSLTDTVTVSVTVAPADNPPTANDDAFTITEDDSEAEFDVQSNDERDVDNQTFVIDSVGTPDQGGSARVSSDGTQFFYTPAADFAGTEEVTYTLRDTGGGLSVATVTFTVDGVNDAPPVIDTTVGLNRGTGESAVLTISDLPENVDDNETLTFTQVDTTTAAGGTARIDTTTNTILYTPPSADFTGEDSFNYTVQDSSADNLTSSGLITINVADFTERDIFVSLPSAAIQTRIGGVMLTGTNLLGEAVAVPLEYESDSAVFPRVLPGDYMVEIPAIPFLQKASEPQQIAVVSAAEDGDMVVDAEVGRLRPEFISILDFLGSTPQKTILAVVSPGETSRISLASSRTDTVETPVVELDAAGSSLTIRGGDPASDTGEVAASVPAVGNPSVQLRGEIDGVRLLKISVEDLVFESSGDDSSGTAPEGESLVVEPLGVLADESPSSTLTLGDVQAEGESVAASATTVADLFVPALDDSSSRSDALVLSTGEEELWLGSTLQQPAETDLVDTEPVDTAMQSVAATMSVSSPLGESVAAQVEADSSLDEGAIDAALRSPL